MTHDQKRLLRQAIAIHNRLQTSHVAGNQFQLPATTWIESEQMLQKLCYAQTRGWHFATRVVQRDLVRMLGQLQRELLELERRLADESRAVYQPTIRDVYADLVALEEEYDEVTFERPCGTTTRRAGTLSVTTEPIELDGVYLGPFRISLDLDDVAAGDGADYHVVALEPNPSASNSSVTHPHVQDDQLCEGEGHQQIRRALREGRVLDFFELVAGVLRTYNPASPFVSLEIWSGAECADCGGNVSDDDLFSCEKCDATVCDECICHCTGCDCVYCNECVDRCEGCEDHCCPECLRHCTKCRASLCRGCLDENERCTSCHDQEPEELHDTPNEASVTPGAARAAVQPHCLGEALVPA